MSPSNWGGGPIRNVFLTSAIALFGLAAIPASAMPVAPPSDAPTSITQVAMGCGPGWTRGPYGHCHHIRGYGGYGVGVVAPIPGVGVVARHVLHTSDQPTRDLQWLWNDP
jgi:hypothetical protein